MDEVPTVKPGDKFKTVLRDKVTKGMTDVELEFIDQYLFFFRCPTSQIVPVHMSGIITNIPQNWQFPGDEPKSVVGCSIAGEDYIFYLETENQTLTREILGGESNPGPTP